MSDNDLIIVPGEETLSSGTGISDGSANDISTKTLIATGRESDSEKSRQERESWKMVGSDWYVSQPDKKEHGFYEVIPTEVSYSAAYIESKRNQHISSILEALEDERLLASNRIAFFESLNEILETAESGFLEIDVDEHFIDILTTCQLTVLKFAHISEDNSNRLHKILERFFKTLRTRHDITFQDEVELARLLSDQDLLPSVDLLSDVDE